MPKKIQSTKLKCVFYKPTSDPPLRKAGTAKNVVQRMILFSRLHMDTDITQEHLSVKRAHRNCRKAKSLARFPFSFLFKDNPVGHTRSAKRCCGSSYVHSLKASQKDVAGVYVRRWHVEGRRQGAGDLRLHPLLLGELVHISDDVEYGFWLGQFQRVL